MPAMTPAKHAIPDRIMNARVAFQYAGDTEMKIYHYNLKRQIPLVKQSLVLITALPILGFDLFELIFEKLPL